MSFEERWYQTEAENAFFDYFEDRYGKPGNPVIAMPTGTGKSPVQAKIFKRLFSIHPGVRILALTGFASIIEQNAKTMLSIWPNAPIGIHSAELGQRDTIMPIIFGGVKSVVGNIADFGYRDFLFIDEAHTLSPEEDSMYMQIIAGLLRINPWLRVVGLSATPYRLKQGLITEGTIFTDICYDITDFKSINRLVYEGFLSPLVSKKTGVSIDVSGVKMTAGEYNQKQAAAAADVEEITRRACEEMVQYGQHRMCWMVFASSIQHAEHISEHLRMLGIEAAEVHSKLAKVVNNDRIEMHKRGQLQALVNMGKLTTGYDHRPIDLIGMLRATASPGLMVQMLGRGTRISPETGKRNCLVLDFAKNIERLGPFNDPKIPNSKKKGTGDAPVWICPECDAYNHASARYCDNCGEGHKFKTKLKEESSDADIMRDDTPEVLQYSVSHVTYENYEKPDKTLIKVTYYCGMQRFTEWINFEAKSGLLKKEARDWWRQRHKTEPPATNYEALQLTSQLRTPRRIKVWVNRQYPKVTSCEY
ncbi:DNA/RNA helicase [Xanthomonas phage XAJ2]|uniref:DNA/RNA helicase n=1 Tax=Xanthomonas phage XAJ2 TaxID=1775249 RepID=A0A1I9L2F9_9CAUD|nr:DNA/RNA helicase [Xanthomonas phage XAJ2]